ncbi:hypothetical protein, partial [Akkermansia sp.]|uniref:hypothetical protein n=1 Tax=Akkermansia sp. TaxID=1872421 RepID=UPI003A8B74F0
SQQRQIQEQGKTGTEFHEKAALIREALEPGPHRGNMVTVRKRPQSSRPFHFIRKKHSRILDVRKYSFKYHEHSPEPGGHTLLPTPSYPP